MKVQFWTTRRSINAFRGENTRSIAAFYTGSVGANLTKIKICLHQMFSLWKCTFKSLHLSLVDDLLCSQNNALLLACIHASDLFCAVCLEIKYKLKMELAEFKKKGTYGRPGIKMPGLWDTRFKTGTVPGKTRDPTLRLGTLLYTLCCMLKPVLCHLAC
jgi:hypothetical protein